MFEIRNRKSWIALLGILLLFAACKGETPTAPPAGGGNNGGGSQPPSNVSITLSTSNATPIIDSTVTITATVTLNGTPVANGTAVEFVTSAGTFIDVTPAVTSLIRTTTNGIATVNLTSPNAVVAHVTATVNNVTRSVDVTFRTVPPCIPPDPRCPPGTDPTITGVNPNVGRPQGGEIIHITGTNFLPPVRVLFDVGTGTPIQGFVTNIAADGTSLDVITPLVNVATGQQVVADIIIVTQVGSSTEKRAVGNDLFTFRNTQLTPSISSLSPTSGPINGGTAVTIFGDGFQPPVQVFFGSAEAQVVSADFGQIRVIAPDARSTNPNGSGAVTGPVTVTVVNIASNTRATSPQQFRYVSKMQITTISPFTGPATGGTDINIDGTGFDGPLSVSINGIEAQVLQVTGTRLLVRTTRTPSPCSPPAAAPSIFVTNTENGDTDTWGDTPNETNFTFIPINPEITAVTPATAGQSTTLTVRNPGIGPLGEGSIRFSIVGKTLIPTPSLITNGTASQIFTVTLPLTGFTFPQEACTTTVGMEPGTRNGPVDTTITFQNLSTGCNASALITVNPPSPNPCLTEPQPRVSNVSPAVGSCAAPPDASVAGAPAQTNATITISNDTEAQPLNITGVTIGGADAADFTIAPTSATNIAAGGNRVFTLTFNPSAVGPKAATVTFTTNSTSTPSLTVCVQANAIP